MIDVQKLLGQFLGADAARGGSLRPGDRQAGGFGGGGIEDRIGGFLKGQGGGLVTGALASGLASQLFRGKGLGKMGGSAVKLGGAAIVAGLAYKAYQSYQAQQAGTPRPPASAGSPTAGELPSAAGTSFLPHGEEDRRALLMLSAMIAAAKADGYIDAGEEKAIFGRVDQAGLDAEEKAYVLDEMRKPASIDDLVSRCGSTEEAVEVFTASVLAVDADHPAERAYLDLLAARLDLDPALVAEIRRTTTEATAAA